VANVKIPELNALTNPSPSDLVPVADVSTVNDEVKKTSVGEIVGIITGDVEVATDGTATISELPVSKLADGFARQLLQTDAAGTGVEWTSNIDVPGTLDVTGATTLDLTLGVNGQSTLASAAVSDLTEDRVVIAGANGELEDSANLTFDGSELGITGTLDVSSNATVGGDLTVVGDLTVEGATTTLETQTVTVEDKNIELGVVDTPTDTTADGGGITLRGATDKTINWIDATDAWTFSEHVDIASAKEFRIAGTKVLDATSLGSAVVSSSLASVGTLTSGELGAGFTTVATAQGGTGQTTYSDGELLIGKTDGTLAKATLTGGTGVDVTNADGSVTVAIDSTVVTTSDTGTVTSAMISDGTIVNNDINASAAIAGTKIDPDFGNQTVETTGDLDINTGLLKVTSGSSAIGFFSTTPATQPSAIADITSTATSGALPTADGSITIADAATPTATELLEYCVELESKLETALAALRTLGLIAT